MKKARIASGDSREPSDLPGPSGPLGRPDAHRSTVISFGEIPTILRWRALSRPQCRDHTVRGV